MIVSFHAHGHTKITMFGDVALEFLQMMGLPAKVPGTLLPADIEAAKASLEKALQNVPEATNTDSNEDDDDEEQEAPISMSSRAMPLLKLLDDAKQDDTYISWQEGFSTR